MTESRQSWESRQIAAAAALIKAEADAAEAKLLASGSRAPVMTSGHRHFEWFVHYQVLGESQQRIAHANYVQPVTVRMAIGRSRSESVFLCGNQIAGAREKSAA